MTTGCRPFEIVVAKVECGFQIRANVSQALWIKIAQRFDAPRDPIDLVAILHDETKRNPLTVMPPFGRNRILTEKEINAIVDFLQTL